MAITFPFDPNWADPYIVSRAYLTEVITAYDRTEQRRAHRIKPRKTIAYSATEFNGQARRLRHYLRRHHQAAFVVPELTRFVKLGDPIAKGAALSIQTIPVIPNWLIVGIEVCIGPDTARDVGLVTGIAGTEVTILCTFAFAHKVGEYLQPALRARLAQELSWGLATSVAGDAEVQLEVEPSTVESAITPAAGTMHNGRELWLKKPNWKDPPEVQASGQLKSVDYQIGTIYHKSTLDWNYEEFSATYLGRDPAAVEDMIGFFDRMMGMRGSFYTPTWEPDIPILSSSASSVVSSDPEIATMYSASPIYKSVIACFRDGTFEAKRLAGITGNGTTATLTMTSPWTRQPTLANCLHLSWLPCVRFSSDDLSIEWVTRTAAQWKIGVRQIKEP